MLKDYKPGFEAWGLLLFLIIMVPNFIWFAVPAPNDVLRAGSITEAIDTIASVCRILMIAALCMLKNKEKEKLRISPFIIVTAVCCLLYFAGWIAYYCGAVNAIVISGLTVPPCLAFLFFALDRKNRIAAVLASIYAVCHLIYGAVNFII